jgi:3-oxocholest-4-en-26-oate---CoA ligase
VTSWNFAEVWETCAGVKGDAQALACGEARVSWAQFDRHGDGIARTLLDAGLSHQDKVAHYLYNCNEYLESMFGIFKASLVPVNTNYRYGDGEIEYLWENADAAAVVFHGTFTETVGRLRSRLPLLRCLIHVDDGTEPCPPWAIPYEQAAAAGGSPRPVRPPTGRSPDDLYMLYTGGTTGMPKGVMWRQDDLFAVINADSPARLPDDAGQEALVESIAAFAALEIVLLPACPLMHGTGAFSSIAALNVGGSVVTMPDRQFRADRLLDTIVREKVRILTIVGDAFARPIVAALDATPARWDLSSLLGIVSSGVMWSEESKHGLLRHNPNMLLLDTFSSSEAVGMGMSVSTGGTEAHTATFTLGSNAVVIDEDGRRVEPGSGTIGRLAIAGRVPLGYYKDPEKTARTFPTIGGQRYSVPGDYATVDSEGTIHLLGRGSAVINSGGEKVFPEEVEEAVKTHPAVEDAAAVGLPDDRFGEVVVAVVQLSEDAVPPPTADEIIQHVKARLAAFKAPRRVVFVPSLGRTVAGKLDYAELRGLAEAQVRAASAS